MNLEEETQRVMHNLNSIGSFQEDLMFLQKAENSNQEVQVLFENIHNETLWNIISKVKREQNDFKVLELQK